MLSAHCEPLYTDNRCPLNMADTMTEKIPEYVLFDMDNTLYDFYFAKKQSCEAVVNLTGGGEPMELFRYFLRGSHGFEDHANIRDFLKDHKIFEPSPVSYTHLTLPTN